MHKYILIVEDDADDQYWLAIQLRRLGVVNPIGQLSDGEMAIDYLCGKGEYGNREQYPIPSVLFVDLRMPRKSGFDVLEWLQENPLPGKCLVIVVSDPQSRPDLNRAYSLGAHSFLSKPLDPAEIRQALRSFPEYWEFEQEGE